MKKLNVFLVIVLLTICVLDCFAAEDDNLIDKETLERASRNYVLVIYHDANYPIPTREAAADGLTTQEERFFKLRITFLLHSGKFEAAFRIPELVRSRLETDPYYSCYRASQNAGQSYDRKSYVIKMIDNLNAFVTTAVEDYYRTLLHDRKFSEVFELTDFYIRRKPAEATVWLEQVRSNVTARVENLARKVTLLSGVVPDLEAEERAQATAIIHSFPEDHELRTHLQERFDAILAAPPASVPDESQRTILRRMADRLFG